MTPENFNAPFTTAEGWGTFSQKFSDSIFTAALKIKWGKLALKKLSLMPPGKIQPSKVSVTLEGKMLPAALGTREGRLEITLSLGVLISAGQILQVTLT